MHVIDVIARRQHGVFHLDQALEAEVSPRTIRGWMAQGKLERVHPGVYRTAGAPRTWEQAAMAAALAAGPGSAISHRSSGRLWTMVPPSELVEVVVPRGRLPRLAGVTVHRTRDPIVPRLRSGIPVTDPMRTLIDLGAVLRAWEVEDALDRGLAARLFSVAAVEWALAAVARPGRDGCGVLRRVLDERALGAQPPDGLLEPRMARLMRAHGLPAAEFQHEVVAAGVRFVIDFAYPSLLLAIEVDGYAAHSTPASLQHDLRRQNALSLLGWRILRFTWADVVRRPSFVAQQIRCALGTLTAA